MKRLAILTLTVLLISQTTSAAPVLGTASWSATIGPTDSQGFVGQTFTGSATFSYDSTDVAATGSSLVSGLVTTFSQNISTIGTTTYDTSNVGYYLFFFDGSPSNMVISGTPGNQGVASFNDDFFAQDIPGTFKRFAVSVATESGVAIVNPAIVDFTFTVKVPGDADGDGDVDLLDLDILGANFGTLTGATCAEGDFDGDGDVDLLDLDILGANLGFGVPSASVPEPASICLAVLAASCLIGRRN